MTSVFRRVKARRAERRHRLALLEFAVECVRHGWPVVPGSWWSYKTNRHVCGIPGCLSSGLHPDATDRSAGTRLAPPTHLEDFAIGDENKVIDRWSRHPYGILMPTGIACDVIEIPGETAKLVWPEGLTEQKFPVALLNDAPDGDPSNEGHETVFLFAKSCEIVDSRSLTELADAGAVLHRAESWVPIPPTTVGGHNMRWASTPESCGWELFPLSQVAQQMLERLDSR